MRVKKASHFDLFDTYALLIHVSRSTKLIDIDIDINRLAFFVKVKRV